MGLIGRLRLRQRSSAELCTHYGKLRSGFRESGHVNLQDAFQSALNAVSASRCATDFPLVDDREKKKYIKQTVSKSNEILVFGSSRISLNGRFIILVACLNDGRVGGLPE